MSIGLFSTRGTAAARPVYEITSPVFDEVSIQLDKRYYPADRSDRFVIRTYGNSDKNCYIQRARLNAGCSTTSGSRTKNSHAAACSSYGWGPSPTPAGEPGNSPNSGRHIPHRRRIRTTAAPLLFRGVPARGGRGREQREKAGSNGRSREQCGYRNARNARQRRTPRNPASGVNLPDRRQKAGGGNLPGRQHTAESGRAAIRRAGGSIAHREDFMYIQTARNGRTMHTPARRQSRAQGIGDRFGTVQTRLRQNHAGKQVLSTEIPEILRIWEIQRMFTNYHKKELKKVVF